MRVIAGTYKRRILDTIPGNDVTRPTSDRVKENVFNILSAEMAGAFVLDLFAGSGALGIEALSRGARHVIFVDKNPSCCEIIQKNLDTLKILKENYIVIQSDASLFLKMQGKRFEGSRDLIFADPPYDSDWYARAFAEIEESQLCQSACLLVLEMSAELKFEALDNRWQNIMKRQYGKTNIEIYKK